MFPNMPEIAIAQSPVPGTRLTWDAPTGTINSARGKPRVNFLEYLARSRTDDFHFAGFAIHAPDMINEHDTRDSQAPRQLDFHRPALLPACAVANSGNQPVAIVFKRR